MTTDDFIRQAQADWRAQGAGAERALERLRRGRWTPHALLGMDLAASALAALGGLWFAAVAVNAERHQLLLFMSAAVLIASAPILAIFAIVVRRRALRWEDETPERILRVGVDRAEASLQALRAGRWSIATIAAFVAVLWILEAAGVIDAMDFLMIYTPVALGSCFLSEIWIRLRTARLRREREAYVRLLREFDETLTAPSDRAD